MSPCLTSKPHVLVVFNVSGGNPAIVIGGSEIRLDHDFARILSAQVVCH